MELQEQLKYCKICENRKADMQRGLVCGLTNEKPNFENECPDFKADEAEAQRLLRLQEQMEAEENENDAFGLEKSGIKAGVAGGILMMVIAVIWFVVGWFAGYIFYYPPILFLIGVFALVKGIFTGNFSGKKKGS